MADGQVLIDSKLDVGGIDKGVDKLSKKFEGLAADVKSAANKIDREMDSVDIADSAERELRKVRNSFEDTADKAEYTSERIEDSYEEAADEQSDAFRKAWNETERYSDNGSDSVKRDMDSIGDKSKNVGGDISGSFQQAFSAVAAKVAIVMSAIEAVKEVLEVAYEFGKEAIESSAEIRALNAQFEQTFKGVEKQARKSLSAIAKEVGIAETRMQNSYAGIYAFAKVVGADSAEALDISSRAMLVAADSAAYYDKSIEEVTDTLYSFLKGNFENDAALGIAATETTRNAKANELYAKSFIDLSEAQKVDVLLAMVEAGNELSGAMGQAARESDSWANKTGELEDAWKQFTAAAGDPVLDIVIDVIGVITEKIRELTATMKSEDYKKLWAAILGTEYEDPASQLLPVSGRHGDKVPIALDSTEGEKGRFDEQIAGIKAFRKELENLAKPLKNIDFEPAANSAKKLYEAIDNLAEVVGEVLKWAYEEIMVPLSEWYIEEDAPALVEALAAAFELLAAAIELLAPWWDFLWDYLLNPLLSFVNDMNVQTLENITLVLESMTTVMKEISKIRDSVFPDFSWTEGTSGEIDGVTRALSGLVGGINSVLGIDTAGFGDLFSEMASEFNLGFELPIISATDNLGTLIFKTFFNALKSIKGEWGGFDEWWDTNVGDAIGISAEELRTALNSTWEGMLEDAQSLWSDIAGAVTGWLDAIMEKIRSLDWSAIWSGFLSGLTGLPVPSSAGPTSGPPAYDPASLPIPYLASGAVIPPNAPFLAMLGDQRNGTNIEAPLATIQQALADVLGEGGGDIEVKVTFDGDLAQLGRFLNPVITAERKRRGGSLSEVVTV